MTTLQRGIMIAFAAACVPCTGCLLFMAGAAGAGGYAYFRGKETATYDAEFAPTWSATHDALTALGLPIVKQSQDSHSGRIETLTGTQKPVTIHVEQVRPKIPTDPPRTRVGVRVGAFGDEEVSGRILQQIPLPRAGT